MEFRNDCFFLDEDEVRLLSLATMSDVEVSYPAVNFFAGLNEIQTEAESYIQKIALQNTSEKRQSLQTDILKQLIATCEMFKGRAYVLAQEAGLSIRLH